MILSKALEKHSVIGVVGNRSSGKTMTTLTLLKDFKRDHPHINIAVMGVEHSLHEELQRLGFTIVTNKLDILDLKLKETLIYVAEFGLLFDGANASREAKKIRRFFDRIEHNHCKLIIDTARQGFYNKFISGNVTFCIVKEIDYESLVRGTWINEAIRNQESTSDYRMESPVDKFVTISNKGERSLVHNVPYVEIFDTKRFKKGIWTNLEKNTDKLTEQKQTPKKRKKSVIVS